MTNETNEHIVTFCNGTNDNKDVLVIYDKASKTWPFFVRANGYVSASNIHISGDSTFAGKLEAATGSFSGEITATSGSFTGEVYASKGTFSKGTLSECVIKDGCWFGDASASEEKRIKVNSYSGSSYLFKGTGNNRVGFGGDAAGLWIGSDHSNSSASLRLLYDGTVEAKSLKADEGLYVNGTPVSLDGHTHSSIKADSDHVVQVSSSGGWAFAPEKDEAMALGKTGHKWGNIYSKNSTINTSDENEKDIFSGISTDLENFFMGLTPVQYKWKNFKETDHHDRIHLGFGAQSTAKAAESIGLDPFAYSMICKDDLQSPTPDGRNEEWGLRYPELHALEVHMIQKQQKEIEELKAEIQQLKSYIS